ncbi:PhzF family phenazine biosynthesis protein [Synechococcus sp. PCC 7336]|uniref:PhzF family phenazine biosynthesis protein n=1 Tax=Synechococcus sp. PCC 7336 TaxID=195250 RepID=UPI00038049E6|nr:PhzF family phenazine biosynthesis protein [Synechococcus sp. PCC 7336]
MRELPSFDPQFVWERSPEMPQSVIQVDAFTDRPFAGNPAAICVMAEAASDEWMQQVAAEMNLSETAFVVPCAGEFGLRWFTPAIEVDFCGHATLASAHVLWSEGHLPRENEARFHTRVGVLTARLAGDWIELNFPAKPVTPIDPPPALLEALGVEAIAVSADAVNYCVEIESADRLRSLQPNFALLAQLPKLGTIVTCRSDRPEYAILSRYFAPAAGIDEDPVTGSAHSSLGPYWQAKLGQSEFVAYQASPRGGVVEVRNLGDRVSLRGRAVTVLRGELLARSSK